MTRQEYLDKLSFEEIRDLINEGVFWKFDIPDDVTADDIIKWIKEHI